MPDVARRIGRLHLTVGREEDVYRGRVLVEDALRVASFPPLGGRLLVIRRLDLGALDLRASSATVAMTVEAATLRAVMQAVPHDDRAGATASAVSFPDAATAVSSFIRRLIAGPRPTEWFWAQVVPGWEPTGSTAEGCRAALHALLDRGGGAAPQRAVHLAVAVDALRRAGVLDAVLATLSREDGAALLTAAGVRPPPPVADAPTPARADAPLWSPLAAWTEVLGAWSARWGTDDPRTHWVTAMALLGAAPQWSASEGVAERVVRLRDSVTHAMRLRRPSGSGPRPGAATPPRAGVAQARDLGPDEPNPPETGARPTGRYSADAPVVPDRLARRPSPTRRMDEAVDRRAPWTLLEPRAEGPRGRHEVHQSSAGPSRGGAGAVPGRAALERPLGADTPSHALDGWHDAPWTAEPTAAAGLFFAVPLLQRLSIDDALAADPVLLEVNFASRLLEHVADRVGVDPDDPIRQALPPPAEGDGTPDLEQQLRRWCSSLRRSCRRQARMGLCTLVRRPGIVVATRTHLDVILPLGGVDVRVRRAGLDVDPGWVPWLGRVVCFHYRTAP